MCAQRSVCREGGDQCLLELLDGWGHLDVLAPLQLLLTLDQVVDPINHRLHQLDLRGHIHKMYKKQKELQIPSYMQITFSAVVCS